MHGANKSAVQTAPVDQHQHGGDRRKRISRGRVIEDSSDTFQCGQRRLAPDLQECGPVPVRHRCELREIDIRRALDRSERGELKNKIGEPEQNKREPDAFVSNQTAKAVAQRQTHRIKQQHDYVAAQQPDQRVNAGQTREHLLA